MTFDITTAHREILDHLLDPEFTTLSVVPAALSGHYPRGSYQADMPIDWLWPIMAFTHPADPTRLLISVHTTHLGTLVALDHIAHHFCEHPICTAVNAQRERELAEIPADGALFALCRVETPLGAFLTPYMVHIDDLHAAENGGWTGSLTEWGFLATEP
ncbi:hypothetical protein OG225_43415 (plasmid) [Nocardia sp. NBC_01377]|uniref:hypothetical protein n=1 Tax=Nocardia sp. NBC_01377 TaxID=2903595 RepID=UPI002F919C16